MKMMEEGEERAMDCDKGGKVLRTVQERNIEVKGRDGGKALYYSTGRSNLKGRGVQAVM